MILTQLIKIKININYLNEQIKLIKIIILTKINIIQKLNKINQMKFINIII